MRLESKQSGLGLVSKVFPAEKLVDEAIKMAETICEYSQPIVMLAKEAVNSGKRLTKNNGWVELSWAGPGRARLSQLKTSATHPSEWIRLDDRSI